MSDGAKKIDQDKIFDQTIVDTNINGNIKENINSISPKNVFSSFSNKLENTIRNADEKFNSQVPEKDVVVKVGAKTVEELEKLKTSEIDNQKSKDEDINKTRSKKTGLLGVVENIIRKFSSVLFPLFVLPLVGLYIVALAGAMAPAFAIYDWVQTWWQTELSFFTYIKMGFGFGFGFVTFGFSLMAVVPILNFPLILMVRKYKGPWFSLESIPWYYHNALLYLVRYTILDFVTPSPMNIWFYKAMGMKIGKNSIINTSNISDACLIEIGDYVTVGGSAYLMAHYGVKGYLVIDTLKIENKAMIGLKAKLLGGVHVGEKAVIAPNAVVLPKTAIAANSKYGY